MTSLEYLGKEI